MGHDRNRRRPGDTKSSSVIALAVRTSVGPRRQAVAQKSIALVDRATNQAAVLKPQGTAPLPGKVASRTGAVSFAELVRVFRIYANELYTK